MTDTVPKLTFSAINCNSLNMSSIGHNNHLLKIYGITSLRTDIVFLSDVRLCNAMGVSNSAVLTDSFRTNPYGAYKMTLHSRSNKRGVGILIKHSIEFYGPNNVQAEFFQSLKRSLVIMGDYPIIMGGDWNCTTSCENSPLNDDIINMRTLSTTQKSMPGIEPGRPI
jgi:hypothetical protein